MCYDYKGSAGQQTENRQFPSRKMSSGSCPTLSSLAWAVENGITNGTGMNVFSPNADCTRAQIVTVLWRALAE